MHTLRTQSFLLAAFLLSCGVERGGPAPVDPTESNLNAPNEPVSSQPEETQPADDLPPLPSSSPEVFGAPLADGVDYVDFDALLADPSAYTQRVVETRGVVRASCQVRGCWMEVRSARDAKSSSMTVRFKNYSFFVPLDSRRADVRYQGVMKVQKVGAAQVADYEAEGYVFDTKNEDGSVTLIEFTASGVEMWRQR